MKSFDAFAPAFIISLTILNSIMFKPPTSFEMKTGEILIKTLGIVEIFEHVYRFHFIFEIFFF